MRRIVENGAELRDGRVSELLDLAGEFTIFACVGTTLGIVADFNGSKSHVATNDAIRHGADNLGLTVEPRWVHTSELSTDAGWKRLKECQGFWIGPGSPYSNMEGVLAAIKLAREQSIPLLGTCGGFQHIIIEYARNVLGIPDAEHEESAPNASRLFISRLSCSLVGRAMTICLERGSRLASIYGREKAEEEYLCNFGVNPEVVEMLRTSALRPAASDSEGAIRAVDLPGHPFFIGTLYLPQHRSKSKQPHPVISEFVRACAHQSAK